MSHTPQQPTDSSHQMFLFSPGLWATHTTPSLTGSPLLLPKFPSRNVFSFWNLPMSISPNVLLPWHLPHCQLPLQTAYRLIQCHLQSELSSLPSCTTMLTSPGKQVYQGRVVLPEAGTPPEVVPHFRKLHQQQCCSWYLSCQPTYLSWSVR